LMAGLYKCQHKRLRKGQTSTGSGDDDLSPDEFSET
jgi:hypothetical protein